MNRAGNAIRFLASKNKVLHQSSAEGYFKSATNPPNELGFVYSLHPVRKRKSENFIREISGMRSVFSEH